LIAATILATSYSSLDFTVLLAAFLEVTFLVGEEVFMKPKAPNITETAAMTEEPLNVT